MTKNFPCLESMYTIWYTYLKKNYLQFKLESKFYLKILYYKEYIIFSPWMIMYFLWNLITNNLLIVNLREVNVIIFFHALNVWDN